MTFIVQIELQERKGESMPNGWAIDKEGKVRVMLYTLYLFNY